MAQPLCLLPAGLPEEDALIEPDGNFQSSCHSLLQTRVMARVCLVFAIAAVSWLVSCARPDM